MLCPLVSWNLRTKQEFEGDDGLEVRCHLAVEREPVPMLSAAHRRTFCLERMVRHLRILHRVWNDHVGLEAGSLPAQLREGLYVAELDDPLLRRQLRQSLARAAAARIGKNLR